MANLKVGNTNIGKISIIEPFKEIGANPSQLDYQPHREAWVRPTEWLDMPNIGSGDNSLRKCSRAWCGGRSVMNSGKTHLIQKENVSI